MKRVGMVILGAALGGGAGLVSSLLLSVVYVAVSAAIRGDPSGDPSVSLTHLGQLLIALVVLLGFVGVTCGMLGGIIGGWSFGRAKASTWRWAGILGTSAASIAGLLYVTFLASVSVHHESGWVLRGFLIVTAGALVGATSGTVGHEAARAALRGGKLRASEKWTVERP